MFWNCATASCDQVSNAIEFCGAQLQPHQHSRLRSENIYDASYHRHLSSPPQEDEVDQNIRKLRASIAADERRSSEAQAELIAIRSSYESKRRMLRNLQKKQDSIRTEVECTCSKKMVLQRRIAELEVCADICKDGLNDKTEELRQLQEQCKILEARAVQLSQCEMDTINNVAEMHKQLTTLFSKTMSHTPLDRPDTRYQSPSRHSTKSVKKEEPVSDRIETNHTLESSVTKSPLASRASLLPCKISPAMCSSNQDSDKLDFDPTSGIRMFEPHNKDGLFCGLLYHSLLDSTPRIEIDNILALIADLRDTKSVISNLVWRTGARKARVSEGDIVAVKPIVLHRDNGTSAKVIVHSRVQHLCSALSPLSSGARKYLGHGMDQSKESVSKWLSLHREPEDVYLDAWMLPEDRVKQCAKGNSSYGGVVIGSNLIIFAMKDSMRAYEPDIPIVSDISEYLNAMLTKLGHLDQLRMYENDKYLYSTNAPPVVPEPLVESSIHTPVASAPRTPIVSEDEDADTPAFNAVDFGGDEAMRCVEETLKLAEWDSTIGLRMRQCITYNQTFTRSTWSSTNTNSKGIPSCLIYSPISERIVKVTIGYDNVEFAFINQADEGIVLHEDQTHADAHFLGVDYAATWEVDKFWVLAHSNRMILVWLITDIPQATPTIELIYERDILPQVESELTLRPREIVDVCIQKAGRLRFALLTRDAKVEVWDLSHSVDDPLKKWNLKRLNSKPIRGSSQNVSWAHVEEKSNLGAYQVERERFWSLCWLSETESIRLCVGGQALWVLEEDDLLIRRFPAGNSVGAPANLELHVNGRLEADHAFSALTTHPHYPWLLFAVSTAHHEILAFDLRDRPTLPILHLPLPDVYGTHSVHRQLKWITNEDASDLERLLGHESTELPCGGAVLLVSPLIENARGLLIRTPYFLIPPLSFERAALKGMNSMRIRPNEDDEDEYARLLVPQMENSAASKEVFVAVNPFDFNLSTYSQWTRDYKVHQIAPGSLEYKAATAKKLLLETRMLEYEQKFDPENFICTVDPEIRSREDVMRRIRGAPAIEPKNGSRTAEYGSLNALDAVSFRMDGLDSWESKQPTPLTIPRPPCICALDTTGDTIDVDFDYGEYQSAKVNGLGPPNGRYAIKFSDKLNPADVACKLQCEDTETERSRVLPPPDHHTPDLDLMSILLFQGNELASIEAPAVAADVPVATTSAENDVKSALCCHDTHYCLGKTPELPPRVEKETGEYDEDPPKASIMGLGLPVNRHLINALLESWPEVEPQTGDPNVSLMIARSAEPKKGGAAAAAEEEEEVEGAIPLGLTQEEENWFDAFGTGEDFVVEEEEED